MPLKMLLKMSVIVVLLLSTINRIAWAEATDANTLNLPQPINLAGASVDEDENDIDLYPAIAYDPLTQRHLLVWMSLRNASSNGTGFDLYGIFLDRFGQVISSEFLITDDDYAARSSRPSVAVNDQGVFLVAWTARGSTCQIMAQTVSGIASVADQIIPLPGNGHLHSADVVYNADRQRFSIAYIAGDDYLPPTLFGADVVDCGNNAYGTSQLRVAEITTDNGSMVAEFPLTISQGQASALRPTFVYNEATNQYLVAWEDRRNATGYPFWFDVYAQRLDFELTALGNNFALTVGNDYTNSDPAVPWTPRPTVSAGDNGFLVAWFERQAAGESTLWNVTGRQVAPNGSAGATQVVNQMTYFSPSPDNPPTGFLDSAYNEVADEYLIAISSHAQSIYGYYASARIQRVALDGSLLNINGTLQSQANMGALVDYSTDDQISIAISSAYGDNKQPGYMLIFGHHVPSRHSQDYNIWGSALGFVGLTPLPPNLQSPANWSARSEEFPALQWYPVAQAIQYEVQLDRDPYFRSPDWAALTTGSPFQGSVALPPGIYYWHVRAQNQGRLWGAWSDIYALSISDQDLLLLPSLNR
jgi:hypothetical protein